MVIGFFEKGISSQIGENQNIVVFADSYIWGHVVMICSMFRASKHLNLAIDSEMSNDCTVLIVGGRATTCAFKLSSKGFFF